MLDRKYLRDCPEIVKEVLALRGPAYGAAVDRFLEIDELRRSQQTKLDELKQQRNEVSKEIGQLMKSDPELAEQKKVYVRDINDEIELLEGTHSMLADEEDDLLLSMPNLPHDSIPVGGEDKAQIVKEHGQVRGFSFEPKNHVQLCESLQLVNFEAGVRLAGAGFPVMHGQGAMLQRALINLMLDVHIYRHGYSELRPPFIVHPRCPRGTGQLPKFSAEMYQVYMENQPAPEGSDGPHYFLIPTAEVAVANYYREQILETPKLPVKLCAYSPCWRVEAGSYGKEVRGLARLHQFEKVELVRLSDPARSYEDLEEMTAEAEHILELLQLPYRRKMLPSGDMAFASTKTYDLEVFCPADGLWHEVSSASNTTDYQARRANIRFRREAGGRLEYPHMLNASGLALPRVMIAVLETWQTAEGNVQVPPALQKYLPNTMLISPPEAGVPFI